MRELDLTPKPLNSKASVLPTGKLNSRAVARRKGSKKREARDWQKRERRSRATFSRGQLQSRLPLGEFSKEKNLLRSRHWHVHCWGHSEKAWAH